MPQIIQIIIKALFVLLLTIINYIGVKKAGRVNDVLTILKVNSNNIINHHRNLLFHYKTNTTYY
jgi:hypothetical protein